MMRWSKEASSLELIRGILDSLQDHIAVLDPAGSIIAVNQAWQDFATANGAAAMSDVSVGANYLEVCRKAIKTGDGTAKQVFEGLVSVLRGNDDQFAMDYECPAPSGERWFKMTVLRQKPPGRGAIILHSDITDRKKTEEALRRSEGWFRLLTDSLPVLISYVDEQQRYRFNNKCYELWFGHPPKAIEGKHLNQVLGEKAYQTIRPRVEAVLSGDQVRFEDFIPYRGAGRRYVQVTYLPDRQDNHVRGFFALIQDLTDRKQAEEQILESRNQLSTIITGADVGTWDWDIPRGTVASNERFCTMLGHGPGGFGADVQRFFASLHPDDVANVEQQLSAHFSGANHFYRCDFRLRTADGTYKWIHGAGRLIERTPDGAPQRMVGIHIDINDHKLADEALKDREEEFRSIFELAAVGSAQAHPETGRFIRVNRKFCEITGYSEEELLQMTYRDITYAEDREEDTADIQKVIAGERSAWSREKRYVRKDGSIVWAAVNGTAIRLNGRVRCTVKNIIDITERKSYERAMQAQRQALSNLAAEIAQTQEKERRQIADDLHDQIGQNLVLAKMKLGALKRIVSGPVAASIQEVRALIDQSIKDSRSLIRELSPQVLYELGLDAAVHWLAEHTQAKYGLRCTAEVAPRVGKRVREDVRVILFQAARELLVNVAKHAKAAHARVVLKADDSRVTVQVIDDGCGFDPSALTLPSSSAKGFGLFSIRERIALLGGELRIDSTPERGTRVTVAVPR
jgi:PAS domain S-box-containing protein